MKHHPTKDFQQATHGTSNTQAASMELAPEEDAGLDHDGDSVHKVLVHSVTSSTTTSSLSNNNNNNNRMSSTKRPSVIQLSSGDGVLHVLGSKDQFWTTRYPEIPKYVTIVTTTRRPYSKGQRQHATRRMDTYVDAQSSASAAAAAAAADDTADNAPAESDADSIHLDEHHEEEEFNSHNQQQHTYGEDQDQQEDDIAGPSEDHHELDMIESNRHDVKVWPPGQTGSSDSRRGFTLHADSEENGVEKKQQSLPDARPNKNGVLPDLTNNADTEAADNGAEGPQSPPLCPGNCVLPLFSLFCEPHFKAMYACSVPGRVCCMGASSRVSSAQINQDIGLPSKTQLPASTMAKPASAEVQQASDDNQGHEQECSGRCVSAFFQYTCRHPLQITDDVCASGSLCCTNPHIHEDRFDYQGDSNNDIGNTTREEEPPEQDPQYQQQQQQQQQQESAAESAKNKFNLIHSILSTVLSTKRPKIGGIGTASSDDMSSHQHDYRLGSQVDQNSPFDEHLRPGETRPEPSFALPYKPKYFTSSTTQNLEESTSEETSDPPEIVIEPAIPGRPTLDTSFSQLNRPPIHRPTLGPRRPTTFNSFNTPVGFHRRHRTPDMSHGDDAVHDIVDRPPVHRRGYYYPRTPTALHNTRPLGARPNEFNRRPDTSLEGSQDDTSQELPERQTPYMRYMNYSPGVPPYWDSSMPPLPHLMNSNNTLNNPENHQPFEEEPLSQEDNKYVPETTEPSQEERRHPLSLHASPSHSTPQSVGNTQDYTSPFINEWTPTDVNTARVKEVNSVKATQSDETLASTITDPVVHPSSCGLNGFHIKRGPDGQKIKTAKPGEWCWQAAIVDSEDRLLCSGAVIGAQWILTTASCLAQANFTSSVSPQTTGLRAKVGYVDLLSSAGFTHGQVGSQTKTIAMVYSHHSFNAETRDNDVALLKLYDFIDLNRVVCVICLPTSMRPERAIENCTVTAYRREPSKTINSQTALTTTKATTANRVRLTYERVSKVDPQVCSDLAALRSHHGFFAPPVDGNAIGAVSRSKFCAGDMNKAERTPNCRRSSVVDAVIETGDTETPQAGKQQQQQQQQQQQKQQQQQHLDVVGLGNPLVCRIDDEFYQLSGLSSTFLGCSSLASPTIFTNLAYYTGWINQIANVNRYS